MKAEKEETTCLLEQARKGSVKTSIQVPGKGIPDRCPVVPVPKGTGERTGEETCEQKTKQAGKRPPNCRQYCPHREGVNKSRTY